MSDVYSIVLNMKLRHARVSHSILHALSHSTQCVINFDLPKAMLQGIYSHFEYLF